MSPLTRALLATAALLALAALLMPLVTRGTRSGRFGLALGLVLALACALQALLQMDLLPALAGRVYLALLMLLPPLLLQTGQALRNVEVRRRHLSAFVWLIAVGFVVSAGTGDLLYQGLQADPWGRSARFGVLGPVAAAWAAAVLVALVLDGIGQLLTSAAPRERQAAAGVVLAACAFGLGGMDWLALLGEPRAPWGFAASAVGYLLLLVLAWRAGPRGMSALLPARALDAARQPVLQIDGSGRIQAANRAAARLLGQSRRRLLGALLERVVGVTAAHLDAMVRIQPPGYVERLRLTDGREITLQPVALRDRNDEALAMLVLLGHGGLDSAAQSDVLSDPVTGLPGPRLFAALLERALRQGQGGSATPAALLVIRVGDPQAVAIEHGLTVFERLQAAVVERLRSVCDWTQELAWLRPGTYGLLLTRVADPGEPELLAGRLAEALRPAYDIEARRHDLTAALAVLPDLRLYHEVDDVLVDADQTLVAALRQTDGHVLIAREPAQRRAELALNIEAAIAHDGLELEFEPVLDLRSRELVGFRLHLRWNPGGGAALDTDAVQELALRSHLQDALGSWLIRRGAEQLGDWRRDHPGRKLLFWLPLTAATLARDGLVAEFQRLLTGLNLEPGHFVVEVDDQSLLRPGVRKVLTGLSRLGVGLHLSGFSGGSLAAVHASGLNVRSVSLEARLVDAIEQSASARPLVSGLALAAHKLGLMLRAENLVRPSVLAALGAQDVDLARGPVFSPAVDAARARRWLNAPKELAAAFSAET